MHRRLVSLARDDRLAFAVTILSGFLIGILIIGQASLLSHIVEAVFLGGQSVASVMGGLRLLLAIITGRAFLAWLSEVSANAVAIRVKDNLRARLFAKILQLGPAFTRAERTGELTATAVEGVEALDAYFSQYLPQLVLAALVPLSILIVVLPRDLLSGLVLLITAPLIPVFMVLIGKAAESLTRRQWDTLSRLSAHFLDSLQGLTTLKQFGRSREQARSIAESSDRFRDTTLRVLRVTFLSALVLELVATVSTAVVAVEVGLRLLYGHMGFQPALFLLLLAPEFYIPLRMLGLRFHAGMSGVSAAGRIFAILETPTPQPPAVSWKPARLPDQPSSFSMLSFSKVGFTYPGEGRPALQDLDLEIRSGGHVSLVGVSGAGKSTLAALILRFIEPQTGSINLDGRPLSEIPAAAWREQVAWVPQQPYLFHDTLAANLRLAKPDASLEELDTAVQAAHLDQFIQGLPDGYETVVGEEGARLSGGQAQRLALARAYLKNAPFLILDEPTSSLDPENEVLLEESTDRLMQGRTVLTIAHRLNTVYRADRIFVLDQGRLVQEGSHRELLALGGVYGQLVGASTRRDRPIPEPVPEAPRRTEAKESLGFSPFGVSGPDFPTDRAGLVLWRLLGFLRGAWGWVILSVVLGAATIGSNVGLMGTAAVLISDAALHPELGTLEMAIVGVRFFGIARGVLRYGERLVSHTVTFRLLARLRTWFYQALERLAPARLMQFRSGDLLSRIVADVDNLENFYVRSVAPPCVALLVAAGMGAFLAHFDPRLAQTFLLFILFMGLGLPWLARVLSRTVGVQQVLLRAQLHSLLVDGIQGLADLTAFNRTDAYLVQVRDAGHNSGQTQARLAGLNGLQGGLVILLSNLGWWIVLVQAIPLVRNGRIDGVLLATLILTTLAGFEAVLPLPLAAQTLTGSLESARRLFAVVDAQPAVVDPVAPVPSGRSGALSVNELHFSYGLGEQPALDGIDLDLPPGKHLAIVGPSGAGKSTLLNILLRFWDYSQGQVLLAGVDLRRMAGEDVRRQMSVIPQRPYFFNDSIRQNLLLGCPGASESELRAVAQQAQIHDFIMSLPRGYETGIGERGLRLSVGERQRLAIARALLKDAPLLLLDEPTANLDPLTERQILEMLSALARNRSLLLVSHRLVGLEQMDEVLVLDQGRVVEHGRHSELLEQAGMYRRMWDLQNRLLKDG